MTTPPLPPEIDQPKCVVIARLSTSCWHNDKGIFLTKKLTFLKRRCAGHNFVEEDAKMVGADETIARIINFHESKDGIYKLVTCNERRDWETGVIDDYDFKLIPL